MRVLLAIAVFLMACGSGQKPIPVAANDTGAGDATLTDSSDVATTPDASADDVVTPDASADAGSVPDTNADAAPVADVDANATADIGSDASATAVQCGGATPSFPTFAKACQADADCAIGLHQINCCGTKRAIGIASGAKAALDEAEATCASQYPDCDCAQFPTQAEDGKTADDGAIAVRCDAGQCGTWVK